MVLPTTGLCRLGLLSRVATPEQRLKASEEIVRAIHYALMSREEAVQEFERISREMGTYAREQGLTEEKQNELPQSVKS